MFNPFKNQFIQALGLGAAVWLGLRLLGYGMELILALMESFSRWYRWTALPLSEEIGVVAAIAYLLIMAIFNSQKSEN